MSKRMPLLHGPDGGSSAGHAVVCPACHACLTTGDLPRLRLDYSLWTGASRDELLGLTLSQRIDCPLHPNCWYCKQELDWDAFIEIWPKLYALAVAADGGDQSAMKPWFIERRDRRP